MRWQTAKKNNIREKEGTFRRVKGSSAAQWLHQFPLSVFYGQLLVASAPKPRNCKGDPYKRNINSSGKYRSFE